MRDRISRSLLILSSILFCSTTHSGQDVDVLVVQAQVVNSCAVTAEPPPVGEPKATLANAVAPIRSPRALRTAIGVRCSRGTSYSLTVGSNAEVLSGSSDTAFHCLNLPAGGAKVEAQLGTGTGGIQSYTAELAVNAEGIRQGCSGDVAVVVSF